MFETAIKANSDEARTSEQQAAGKKEDTRVYAPVPRNCSIGSDMSLHRCTATVCLLLTFLGAIASGQNVSSTKPPVHNATMTVLRQLTTSFRAPSSSYPPTATVGAVTATPMEPSKSSQAAKRTTPPVMVTTARHTATRETQEAASAETFVMPSVDGLVGGEIRSSMESETTPAEDLAVPTPALAFKEVFTNDTSEPSSMSKTSAKSTADSLTNVTEQVSSATMTSATSTSSTESEREDDISYLASLFPDLDLFDDSTRDGASTPPSVSTTTPAADTPTIEKPSGYNMSRERYCIAARYCYKDLNERCVMRHMKSVCGCGRAFYRNPETLVCERKLPLLVSLELPEHSYVQEVADKKSLEFKAYESAAQHLVREEADPLAFPPLASYEPEDQAFRMFYGTEPAPNATEATIAFALSSQAS